MKNLETIRGDILAQMDLPGAQFCVDTLLPRGISILCGAPKIGKSWLVLDLCIHVAKGEPIWNLETEQGTALYLCLEDTFRRVQKRFLTVTDDPPSNIFFAVSAGSIADGLCEQIESFCKEHPDTNLVVIDTFQTVRSGSPDISYAKDYNDIRILKSLADELSIALLLVHHIRKEDAADPLNKISGTNGISGAVDTLLLLDRSKRSATGATLTCTGRDVEYRELELKWEPESCCWQVVADSLETPERKLPDEMLHLLEYMKTAKKYSGSNTELVDRINSFCGTQYEVNGFKRKLNLWRDEMKSMGILYRDNRSNGKRTISVFDVSSDGDDRATSDGETCAPENSDSCGTADPEYLLMCGNAS